MKYKYMMEYQMEHASTGKIVLQDKIEWSHFVGLLCNQYIDVSNRTMMIKYYKKFVEFKNG